MKYNEYTFEGYTFYSTCSACPEQYDVFHEDSIDEDDILAYVRLRWGNLWATCPDVGGKVIYFKDFDEDYKGGFDSEEERVGHLQQIAKAIKEHYEAS